MSYYYYQDTGGEEAWKPVPQSKLDNIEGAMFITVLSVDAPVGDEYTKEDYAAIKYKGPLYFDLDDAESPGSTAEYAVELLKKLEDLEVNVRSLQLFASGGKGFHILVPEETFMQKPPKAGMVNLPYIYKEIAFKLAVESLDLKVYTARRGRMLRRPGVERPNKLYKVQISYGELKAIADKSKQSREAAEEMYQALCSEPRTSLDVTVDAPAQALGMMAMFDECKSKVTKALARVKKMKRPKLPDQLPSFDALLRGEGVKEGSGFHPIAMQVAITAHSRGMSSMDLVTAAQGLIHNHVSDGGRYDTPGKRAAELARMWEYTEDNPCYEYSPAAIVALLNHGAPDLKGIETSEEEIAQGIAEGEKATAEGVEYDHAGVTLAASGVYVPTEFGEKKILGMGFKNITELVSTESNTVSVLEADVAINGKVVGRKVFELESFNSVSSLNKITMQLGQSFLGNEGNARGLFMRMVQQARRAGNRMFSVGREGLDIISIPFHEDETLRKDFLVWSDVGGVTPQPNIIDTGVQLKFVGFHAPLGHFQSDLSKAPNMKDWLKESPDNVETLRQTVNSLLHCQKPAYVGKLLGWMVACHYRMLFHKAYNKFPLLHINGPAGAGKCFAKDTPILLKNGQIKAVQDVKVGDKLMGADGTVRNVLALGQGREQMYRVKQVYGDDYVVNESHILTLKFSQVRPRMLADGRLLHKGDTVDMTVRDYLKQSDAMRKVLKGYKPERVTFTRRAKSKFAAYDAGQALGRKFAAYGVPDAFKYGNLEERSNFVAGVMDNYGSHRRCGYHYTTSHKKMAEDLVFMSRSLGIKATISEDTIKYAKYDKVVWHVYLSNVIGRLPSKVHEFGESNQLGEQLLTGITVTPEGEGDYYGFEIDGDKLFLLGDFTVVHNTEMTKLMTNLHYLNAEPKMLTPSSTLFAVSNAMTGSASIPLIVDEFKPGEMQPATYDRFKLMFRDAYNLRSVERGGGNKDNSDYRAVHSTALSAPVCFIAEAAESESALMERVVLLTLVKPSVVETQKFLAHFQFATSNSHVLGIIGQYMAAQIVQRYSIDQLKEEFNPIYNAARKDLMLQEGEEKELSSDELLKKSGAKERTVFNYAVVKFGLTKLSNLIRGIFTKDGVCEFDDVLNEMMDDVFSTVGELQSQTVPEWLKVMNNFADMARVDPLQPHHLKEGVDYAEVEYNGKTCLEIYARACYMKYRIYCGATRSKPLFPSDAAFVHALGALPALEMKGVTVKLKSPAGSHILGLDELRGAGFIVPSKG